MGLSHRCAGTRLLSSARARGSERVTRTSASGPWEPRGKDRKGGAAPQAPVSGPQDNTLDFKSLRRLSPGQSAVCIKSKCSDKNT